MRAKDFERAEDVVSATARPDPAPPEEGAGAGPERSVEVAAAEAARLEDAEGSGEVVARGAAGFEEPGRSEQTSTPESVARSEAKRSEAKRSEAKRSEAVTRSDALPSEGPQVAPARRADPAIVPAAPEPQVSAVAVEPAESSLRGELRDAPVVPTASGDAVTAPTADVSPPSRGRGGELDRDRVERSPAGADVDEALRRTAGEALLARAPRRRVTDEVPAVGREAPTVSPPADRPSSREGLRSGEVGAAGGWTSEQSRQVEGPATPPEKGDPELEVGKQLSTSLEVGEGPHTPPECGDKPRTSPEVVARPPAPRDVGQAPPVSAAPVTESPVSAAPVAESRTPAGRAGRPANKLGTPSRRSGKRAAPAAEPAAHPGHGRVSPPLEVTVEIGSIEIVEHAPVRSAGQRPIPVSLGEYLRSRSAR
jgi:hypothetical protein